MGRIVVGVDGSESSRAALVWALEESRLRSADLVVVCAYPLPAALVGLGEAMGTTVALPVSEADMAAYANGIAEASLAGVDPGAVAVVTCARRGHPAEVLEEASAGADLLVVGVGRGEIGHRLLGSVATHCVHHAACPVVVVRGRRRER